MAFQDEAKRSVGEDNAEGETDGSRRRVICPIEGRQSRGLAAKADVHPRHATWIHVRAMTAIGRRFHFCLNPTSQAE